MAGAPRLGGAAQSILVCLLLCVACGAPARRSTGTVGFGSWREMQPSWEKLERIDDWIAAEGLRAPAEELLEAS